MSADRYWKRVNDHTLIPWWNDGRRLLNEAIDKVNDWTEAGKPEDQTVAVLRYLDRCIKTWADRDDADWNVTLIEMREYVSGEKE